jgi:hypothetical protein
MSEQLLELSPETEKDEDVSTDEYLKELLEKHDKIKDKKSFTKEEQELKNEIKYILHYEKKMTDNEIGDFLEIDRSTVCFWRQKHGLESNGYKREGKNSSKEPKHDYPKTERELQLVREFVIKYIARSKSRGEEGNFSLESDF